MPSWKINWGGFSRRDFLFFLTPSSIHQSQLVAPAIKRQTVEITLNNKIGLFQSGHKFFFHVLCRAVYCLTSWPRTPQRQFRLAWHADLTQVEAMSLNCCYSAIRFFVGGCCDPLLKTLQVLWAHSASAVSWVQKQLRENQVKPWQLARVTLNP